MPTFLLRDSNPGLSNIFHIKMEKYLLPLLKGKFTQHQMWDLKTISQVTKYPSRRCYFTHRLQVKDWLNALYLSPGEEHGVAPENEKQFKMALKDVFDFECVLYVSSAAFSTQF